jgi:hypothetical protein
MIFFKVKTEFIYNKMETFFIFTFFWEKTNDKTLLGLFYQ